MPLYQIQAPNGLTYQIEGPDGASQQDVINAVLRQNPEAGKAPAPEVGALGRGARGLEQMLSSQRTGIGSLFGGNEAALSGLQRAQTISEKYPGQDDWEAVKAKYEKSGLLPAVGEYLSRVPGALAEQLPQLAETAAATRAGAMVGGAPGALVGAFTPSFTQQYGSFLERQAEEQRKLGQPVDVNRFTAAAMALPAAGIDVATTLIPMGKGIVKSVFGKEIGDLLFKGATKEAELLAAKKLSEEGLAKTIGKGLAKGAAYEIPGEVTQQLLERAQAGLPLFNDDALAEYGKTAFQTTMLAPLGGVGRVQERSAARGLLQQEEQKRLAEERAAAAKAEEERRATPEYALDIEKQYLDAEQQKKDLLAQVKKLSKDSPTYAADYAENKAIYDQVRTLTNETIRPLSEQYNAVKPALAKIREEERLAKVAPEDVMLEHLGIKMPEVAPVPMRTVIDEFGRITEEPVNKPAPVPELLRYARDQVQAARESGQLMADDYVDYLMQDPIKAAELVRTRTPVPGLDKKTANVVLDGLKLQLKEREKQRAAETKAEFEQRGELLKAPVLPEDEQKYNEIIDFANESQAQATEEMRQLNNTFVKGLSTEAPVVEVSDEVKATDNAERLRNRVEELLAEADKSDKEYRAARAAKERGPAAEAFDRGRTALAQLSSLEESGGAYVKGIVAARRAQIAALNKVQDVADQLRSDQTLGGENKAMAASTPETLANEAARQRSLFITNALQEAALHRRADGKPALTQDEAIKAASKMYDTFNDWVERAKTLSQPAKYEEQIVEPAQMRANKIVRPAVTKRVEVQPAVKGISPAETQHFQERIRAIQRQLLEMPETKVQKESPLLRQQFATTEAEKVAEARGEKAETLGGELRRRNEYVREKMGRMQLTPQNVGRAWLQTRNTLNKAADAMDAGQATRELLDAVEPVVDAVLNRTEIKPVDLQAINDALAAARPTAIEQKEEGQKSLFPEAEEDLGYIRMTPKNFANSPRMRPVWEALDKARAAAKAQAAKQAVIDNRTRAGVATLERIQAEVEKLEKGTQFFLKDTARYTETELAKALVPYPEAGNTPEEKSLLNRYAKHPAELNAEERAQADVLLRAYRETHMPEYQKQLKEAMSLLAKGEQVDALDNQLYSHMADANKKQREAAQALKERVAVYKKAIADIKKTLRSSAVLTPQQQQILEQQDKVQKARDDYQQAVNKAIAKAYGEMNRVLAELLDPEIAATQKALTEAKTTLKEEEAELERIQKSIQEVMQAERQFKQKSEKIDNEQRLAYQQFRYEEKKGIIEDLKERIAKEEEHFNNIYQARHDELDGLQAVAEAMTDKHVKEELHYLELMERQLADMRGDDILKKSNLYPFSAQRLKAQQQVVATAKKTAADVKARAKTDNERVLEFVHKNNLPGIKREAGRVEPLLTADQKKADKLREEAQITYDKASEAQRRVLVKEAQLSQIDKEVGELVAELGQYEHLPNDMDILRALAEDENTRPKQRDEALAKIGVMQNIESLEAQRAAIEEGKPTKKRRALTAPSTAAQGAKTPLRTGYLKTLEQASKAMRGEENIGRARGAWEEDTALRYDEFDFDAREVDGAAVPASRYAHSYDGTRYEDFGPGERRALHMLGFYAAKADGATAPERTRQGLAEAKAYFKKEGLSDGLKFLNSLDPAKFVMRAAPAKKVAAPSRTTTGSSAEDTARAFGTELDTDTPFNGMTFADAARYGAARTSSPMVRDLFTKLAEVFDSAPVKENAGRVYATKGTLRRDGRFLGGAYINNQDNAFVQANRTTGLTSNKIMLHELTHAATVRAMEVSPELGERMESLRQQTLDWLATPEGRAYFRKHSMGLGRTPATIYGLKNRKEFVAELFANRDFQKLLAEIPSTQPRKSIFTRFVETLAKYFNMPAKAAQSLFAEAVALTEEVLNVTKTQIYEGAVPKGGFSKEIDALELTPKPAYASDAMREVGSVADKFVRQQKPINERVRAASGGWLGAETMLVDRFAPLEKAAKYMEPLKGSQMMYYARMYDQRMNFVSQAVSTGAPKLVEKTRKDGQIERVIEAQEGPSIKGVVDILREANPLVGNGEAVNRIFTLYMSAIRAKDKGFDALHFGEDLTEADLKKAFDAVSADKELKGIFDRARNEYNEYNRNMLDFLVQTGAMSKGLAAKLMAQNDYIPWYRERNGVAEMVLGNEPPIRIGSIAEQPYLHELVGGDKPILDFLTSSVQNTNMLADMGLRNLATKNAVYELADIGMAKITKAGSGPNVVKFKDKGEDKYAIVNGSAEIPGELIVKGMEGIPTQMPALVRAMSIPSRLLRKAVTLSPVYMAKQLFRDSLAAPIIAGANFTPVLGAVKQIGSVTKGTLEKRGITGGQQFTGTSEDITKILRDLVSDKTHWMAGLAKAEAMAMEADALTRRAQYDSYIEQGLSEMEATLMSLESMNFNKRGASPSIHWVNSMIPFFNAQIQGLNVLYKALTGKMPFNDRLKIQERLLTRGAMLAAATLVYAYAMEDDEAYQNATPDQKYGNWFVRIPGVDQPVKIPVPFEIGYVFKALPEALYNSMTKERGDEEAVKAFKQILLQTVPGGTSYGIPQAIKPGVEAVLGKSFYTGRDILSAQEQRLLPEEQFRENTSEIAKIIGQVAGVSPIKLEELVRGYTGTMGLAFLQAISMPFQRTGPEAAVQRLSDMPVIGGVFQPNDAGGIINDVYERMKDVQKVEATYKKLVGEGRQAEANALLQERGNEFVQSQMADWFTGQMNKVTQAERAIRASAMSPEEKRRQLDELRKIKITLAKSVGEAADKTKLQGLLL